MFDLSVFAFPISAIAAIALLLTIFFIFRSRGRLFRILSGWQTAAGAMAVTAVLTAVEGTWKLSLQHNVFFIIIVLVTMISLGLVTLEGISRRRGLVFIFCHLGFFAILFGGFFSAPDYRCGIMSVNKYEDSRMAFDETTGMPYRLPFSLRLQKFEIDLYDDGVSPKQYTGTFTVDDKTMTTAVNSPAIYRGWFIYQYDYDRNGGEECVFKLVRDPWLPLTLAGMLMLAAGALLGLGSIWQTRWMLPVSLALAAAFTVISVARINFGTLMPALRSLWFVPHLIVYMLAYSLLAIALVLGILSLTRKNSEKLGQISERLLGTSSSLLVIGMLCGAVWAKFAWGDYWTWDAKECWAAATWLLTLVGTHFYGKGRRRFIVLMILLAFLAMQVTWYGVDYLPSAQFSLHTYR